MQPQNTNAFITDWGVNLTEQLVVQSYMSDATMVFVQGWPSCFPSPPVSREAGPKEGATELKFGKDTITIIPAEVADAELQICARNMAVYDGEWGSKCIQDPSSAHACTQQHLAELSEQFLFDLLIANGERMHLRGKSNNVHTLKFDDKIAKLQLVYIDQVHIIHAYSYSWCALGRFVWQFASLCSSSRRIATASQQPRAWISHSISCALCMGL
jgi:hypothetical protein